MSKISGLFLVDKYGRRSGDDAGVYADTGDDTVLGLENKGGEYFIYLFI